MKIQNKEIGIKIGKKELKFTNLILDSYLDLFADSFANFKEKNLSFCLVNFSNLNIIDEKSIEMNYDTILEIDYSTSTESIIGNTIINKYFYNTVVSGKPDWQEFKNRQIVDIGFANWDNELERYVLYAYLDVSKYNIIVQDNQPISISRVDKITSDLEFWSNSTDVKGAYHLSNKGMLEFNGHDYNKTLPKLYSVGFGVLPYEINKEYLAEELNIKREETGKVEIKNILENEYTKNKLYFNPNLLMTENLKFKLPKYHLLIYKFKLYKEIYEDPSLPPKLVDTKKYYTQYKKIKKYGKVRLSIKYERR